MQLKDFAAYKKQLWQTSAVMMVVFVLCLLGVSAYMALSVGVMCVLCLLCLKDFGRNSFFFFFLASFFVYLMSGEIAEVLFDRHYYMRFHSEVIFHSHRCILISLSFILVGYWFTAPVSRVNRALKPVFLFSDRSVVARVTQVSSWVYWVAYSVLMINTIDTVIFVMRYDYVAYYTQYDPFLPALIGEVGDFAPIALCVFLATRPSKKRALPVMASYMGYAVLSLLIGARGTLIYTAVFMVAYCFYRNYTDRKQGVVWIPKLVVIGLCAAVPFLLAFLFLYEYIRTGRPVEFESIGTAIVDFFVNIGSGSKIIKLGYTYRTQIPSMRFYSLGGVLNYFKYGTLFNLFSLDSIPAAHSVRYATESHAFTAILSYLHMPESFLAGHGTGSCYIAELFADFGYFGVALGSAVYGWFFKKLSTLRVQNWLLAGAKLYVMFEFLKAPRAGYDGFISNLLNVNYIAVVVFIGVLAVYLDRRNRHIPAKG